MHGTLSGAAPLRPYASAPRERVNGEIKRGTEVVGIFPNDASIVRLIGAILLEQSDAWAVQRSRVTPPGRNMLLALDYGFGRKFAASWTRARLTTPPLSSAFPERFVNHVPAMLPLAFPAAEVSA